MKRGAVKTIERLSASAEMSALVSGLITDYRFWIALVLFIGRLFLLVAHFRVIGRDRSLVNIVAAMDSFRTVEVTIQNRKDSAITVSAIDVVRDEAVWRYVLGKIIIGIDAFESRNVYDLQPGTIEATVIEKGSTKSFYFKFDRERSMGSFFWELLNPTMISAQVAGYQILKKVKFVRGPIVSDDESARFLRPAKSASHGVSKAENGASS